jgi:hypothetical protein
MGLPYRKVRRNVDMEVDADVVGASTTSNRVTVNDAWGLTRHLYDPLDIHKRSVGEQVR